jgi:hypothetical protein
VLLRVRAKAEVVSVDEVGGWWQVVTRFTLEVEPFRVFRGILVAILICLD